MAVELMEHAGGKVLHVKVTGKLEKQHYAHFEPEVERLIANEGKLRVLLETHDFHGWKASALWEDVKFDAKHFSEIERLAVVGDSKWEHGMAVFCKPFTTAEVRFFPTDKLADAKAWVAEGVPA